MFKRKVKPRPLELVQQDYGTILAEIGACELRKRDAEHRLRLLTQRAQELTAEAQAATEKDAKDKATAAKLAAKEEAT